MARMWDLTTPIFQCVPNFSEGRRQDIIEALADAIRSTPGAKLIDYSADVDHNRSVMTILGTASTIHSAVIAAAKVAVEHIDLRLHSGVHPRTGAIDVLPVIPIRNAERKQAIALAAMIGGDLERLLGLEVVYYEWNSLDDALLPELRLLGRGEVASNSKSGRVIVGARGPLVAYNINLQTSKIKIAHAIAKQIRKEREIHPELNGIRALGLYIESRNLAQVSMNLTLPNLTPLPTIFNYVRYAALKMGVEIDESEIIGAIPLVSLGGLPPEAILWKRFQPEQILEHWI